MEPIQISTEPATSNTTTSPVVDDVQEVEDTSNFFSSADDNSENAAENTTPVAEEAEEAEEAKEAEEESDEEEEEEEEEEEDESETRNINAIANIVGSAASDSSFARKLYKGLCCMKDLIESLEARGVVFETEADEEDTADEEDEEEEEEEAEEKVETPLFNTAPAVPKVEPLPNAESILGTEIPLNSAEKPAVANESLTPTAPPAEGGKSVLNTLTGFLTGKTPIFSKTRRNKNRRVNKA
jgi:hypothetical protein